MAIFHAIVPGAESMTPRYIKIIKDFLFLLLILVGFGAAFFDKTHRFYFNKNLFFFLLLCFLSIFISYFFNDIPLIILASGVRWLLPVLLIPFLLNYTISTAFQLKVFKILLLLFFPTFVLQIWQAFNFPHWWGTNFFGLAARNTGFFAVPSPMGFFPVVVAYYADNFSRNERLKKVILFVIAPISIYLTASGTGAITYIVFLAIKFFFDASTPSLRGLFVFLMPITILIFIFSLPMLLNRKGNLYEVSGHVRLEIIYRNIGWERLLFSDSFGVGTNTSVNLIRSGALNKKDAIGIIVDSTITSIIINGGLLSLVAFFAFLYGHVRLKKLHFQFLAIFSLFMLTNILFESYPYNLLFGINVLYLAKINQ